MTRKTKDKGISTPIYLLRMSHIDVAIKYYHNGWGGDFGFNLSEDAADYQQKRSEAFDYVYRIHYIATKLGYRPTLMRSVDEKPEDNAVTDIELFKKMLAAKQRE
ncbi:MAG: hypothetical protein FWE64_02635 [Alphaproteobacteria bacterium]|nr:hypothetical protein [Alphaproteobacteria bacterium]